MTALTLFERPEETIRWARDAINELEVAFNNFFKPRPLGPIIEGRKVYGQVIDVDPETGHEVHKFKIFEPLPSTLSRRATEALGNIRNSFDQAVFAAVRSSGVIPENNVHFPWRSGPADLKATLERGEIPTVFWDIIKREEPYPTGNSYPGGNDVFKEIAKLANGKHTVGLTVLPRVTSFTHPTIRGPGDCIIPSIRWDAVNNEMPLAIVSPGMEVEHNYKISLQVTLNEPPPLGDIPAIELLKMFANKSQRFTERIKAECIRLGY